MEHCLEFGANLECLKCELGYALVQNGQCVQQSKFNLI